ncbi:MAG: ribosomal protein S18-alanine N-acetyltransferase [Halobacteriales archaeon]|nr:ribosomal protein S18-alanine N-acetyltransferase [Halobacteriales archaeon]
MIRRATRADLLDVYRIETASFPQPWPYAAFERFLDQPGFLVAGDERVAGFIVADTVPNGGTLIGHVKDLAVRPDARGQGLGANLLGRALSVCRGQGVDRVKLEVRETNDAAKRLYDRFGFEPYRRLPGYYDDGEDAFVMVRSLQ